MRIVTILIGNSDDKLSQTQWAIFCETMKTVLRDNKLITHFYGHSGGHEVWQNACWVVEVPDEKYLHVQQMVSQCRKHFGQDSAAWTAGNTEFI